MRRKFVEADIASNSKDGYAKKGIEYCDRLFHIEEQLKSLTNDERQEKRNKYELSILDEFWKYVDISIQETLRELLGN